VPSLLYNAFKGKKNKRDMNPLDFFKSEKQEAVSEGSRILANVKAYNNNLKITQEGVVIKTKEKINGD